MTKEQVLDLVRAFTGKTIVVSEWSDDEDVHTILLPKPDVIASPDGSYIVRRVTY